MFVLKCIDRKYDIWGYFVKGSVISTKFGWFRDKDVFQTKEEAKAYIQTLLDSDWIRKDVLESDFSIVEVKQYKKFDSCWMTEEYFREMFEEIKD